MKQAIIIFDGLCNLCNATVDFIIRRDRERYFRYTSLQSRNVNKLIAGLDTNIDRLNTVVLVESNKLYFRSTAILLITKKLGFPWSLFYLLIIVPPFLRDRIYKIFAKNRYTWFGKQKDCRILSPQEKELFL